MKELFDLKIQTQFSKELPDDPIKENFSRQVHESCFSFVEPRKTSKPELVHVSETLLNEFGIEIKDQEAFLGLVSGNVPFQDFKSYAMCYGGHQFGIWAGQLGDGRAINVAELNIKEKNWKFQLKGSGATPYSRSADGFSVLRSSVREYLCSEAMYNLGTPTTRALSLIKTGDNVLRDILYNGNQEYEQGAIVCRASASFIRFGSFEIFASRKDTKNLKKLVDYTIKHHFSSLGNPSESTYLSFFEEVASKTREMIIHWQRVGFVHGVMNTDNMSILGQTIDYGPYGWLEDYNPGWTPNTTDIQNKRYRFGNQPSVALWNLTQLANAIYPLIDEAEPLQEILEGYKLAYLLDYHKMMSNKLGLFNEDEVSDEFLSKLEINLTRSEIDYTLFFRKLSNFSNIDVNIFWEILTKSSYLTTTEMEIRKDEWLDWFAIYSNYLTNENFNKKNREEKMKAINPKYVIRNYMAQLAIEDAEKGNFGLIDELYQLLLKPYDDQPEKEKWFAKRPEWANNKVGCSMLSCSS